MISSVRILKTKARFFLIITSILLSIIAPLSLVSQSTTFKMDLDEKVWVQIEEQLNSLPSDSALNHIYQVVNEYCDKDIDCVLKTYYHSMIKFEQSFNLPAAIILSEELIRMAHAHKNLQLEAATYWDQSRYYGAMGNQQLSVICNEKALNIYKELGETRSIVIGELIKLEYQLSHGDEKNVFEQMDSLLARTIRSGDTSAVRYITVRMIPMKIQAKLFDDAAELITYVEQLPVDDPISYENYGVLITVGKGRADLALARNDTDAAEQLLQKTLELCRQAPDHWREIEIMYNLALLESDRNNNSLAKSYLNEAELKAENLELDDLLHHIFTLKANIAQTEKRFEDALIYTKKIYEHQENMARKHGDFDIQRYFLQLEKDQLSIEKAKQQIELKLKKTELRNSVIITFLILLLATGLLIGFYKQRKGKIELSAQNAIIQQQSEKLETLDRAKSRFFANVSHELRTPLSLVVGPLGTLSKEIVLTERKAKLLDIATQNTKILEELINEILDLTKLDMGKMELDQRPTNLNALFQGYCAHFESLAAQKNVIFTVDITVDENHVYNIDQAKFRQFLYNLLNNAFKYTKDGDTVNANLSVVEGNLNLKVIDTGQGIHPEDLPHLFDRYFQTTRSDKPAEGGTGIGLALCAEYTKLLGGKIEVESTQGNGSAFYIQFPVTRLSSDQKLLHPALDLQDERINELPEHLLNHSNNTKQIKSAHKPTILVVEDNPVQQEYLNLILSEKYNTVVALNGKLAIDYLTSGDTCQLILSDLMMPIMDGYQLLNKVKSEDSLRHIPVIMLTGRADSTSKLDALRIGVDDYLIKPYNEEELLVRISNILTNQSARQTEVDAVDTKATNTPDISETDMQWLKDFENYIRKHIKEDTLSVSTLATEFAMSESSLLRQLKRLTGLSPFKYLQEMRLDKARHLLEDRSFESVARVAYEVGYNDVRTFSRSFKQRFGKLPSELIS